MFATEKFSVYGFGAGVYEFGAGVAFSEVMKAVKIFHSMDSPPALIILLCGLNREWI